MEKSLPTLLTPGRFPLSDNEGAQSVIRVAQTINSETISKSLVFLLAKFRQKPFFKTIITWKMVFSSINGARFLQV
jgi:hypothetical protein